MSSRPSGRGGECRRSGHSFARFLLASGRVHVDLAAAVIAPVQPRFEQPRRALPWDEVQQLLRAVDTSTARGLRDHAMLLMMSAYGLGAGEVIRLQLNDIDWNAGSLRVSRPKTGVNFVLPLLAPVARVLARYLRHGRPPNTPTRHVFVQAKVPFDAFTASSAVRHILAKHARAAGIQAPYLGSHVLRHSNAARQLDVGTRARVLSDLLGHRDPESVSAYVRIATQSLRAVSLPVPPKLKNDLRRSSMEEIGSRARIFELEGLGHEKRKYLKWLLTQSVAPKTKIESVITDDAVAMLSEKLSTPLQFEYYLTRALEEAYKVGQEPVGADMIENVLAKDINGLEPRLTRQGYNAKVLAELQCETARGQIVPERSTCLRPGPGVAE